MNSICRRTAFWLTISLGLAACGGDSETPLNTDYSSLHIAASRDVALAYVSGDEQLLLPLKNGVRISLTGGVLLPAASALTTTADGQGPHSDTTVQVEGVDEADLVKYDGEHIYAVRMEPVPATPGLLRNVLKIVKTDPVTAGTEVLSRFVIEGPRRTLPLIYQLPNIPLPTDTSATHYLAAVSEYYHDWLALQQPAAGIVFVPPDRTTVQLLDVSDPYNVAQAWKLELSRSLRASRKIDDTLYLVTNYRPKLPDLILPADTDQKRKTNERRILSATASDLLPHYWENDGAERQLARPSDCLVAPDIARNEGFADLIVITAISLSERRVTDVNCLSTNVGGVYMSRQSLYVGGYGSANGITLTVLHKFALDAGDISYRASGATVGQIGWANASYFMDEYQDDLRIVTTQYTGADDFIHHLTVLRETAAHRLAQLSTLPNPAHPARIGKLGEEVRAVRFVNDRAYVVTAQVIDPLHVIDLSDPAAPVIAGELEIPGYSTYLRPFEPAGSQLLLSIGQQTNAAAQRQGVKVELFDVRDISQPRSLGAAIFGERGSTSAALDDPHALTVLALPANSTNAETVRYRIALPVNVFDTPHPTAANQFAWSYSGLHLLQIDGIESGSPQLHFQGVLKTAQPDGTITYPPYFVPDRSVLHDDSVFAIQGDSVVSSLWDDIHAN